MSKICERCGHCVWGVVDGLCPDCTDDLKPNKKHEAGYKDGYEKGVRDMQSEFKKHCGFENGEGNCCHPETFDRNYQVVIYKDCNIHNCPIAKKLLKEVK